MSKKKTAEEYFTRQLMHWHGSENTRSLPWKQEKDPYKIWLSEIILQQTRAAQGLPYYLRFTEVYPTVAAFAAANDEDAFRIWQGLGYYNRCRNMLATARLVADGHKGIFPKSYEGLIGLKGIGPYTAAAIASFAYGLPHAVVDGNVYRVLSRYFGIDTPFDSTAGKKEFQQLAQLLLDTSDSSAYNQAIMDLGATVCTPKLPKCDICPLQKHCTAYRQDMVALLPVRSKKQQVVKRHFNYILLTTANALWLHKRTDKDIWQNLYEPYLVESGQPLDSDQLRAHPGFPSGVPKNAVLKHEGKLSQKLTHRIIESQFYSISLKHEIEPGSDGSWVPFHALKNYAMPKTVLSFLEKKLYF
jgi:A/G-specific adenine glycosylase